MWSICSCISSLMRTRARAALPMISTCSMAPATKRSLILSTSMKSRSVVLIIFIAAAGAAAAAQAADYDDADAGGARRARLLDASDAAVVGREVLRVLGIPLGGFA